MPSVQSTRQCPHFFHTIGHIVLTFSTLSPRLLPADGAGGVAGGRKPVWGAGDTGQGRVCSPEALPGEHGVFCIRIPDTGDLYIQQTGPQSIANTGGCHPAASPHEDLGNSCTAPLHFLATTPTPTRPSPESFADGTALNRPHLLAACLLPMVPQPLSC